MNSVVQTAVTEIRILSDNIPEGKHIVTGDIRKLSARLYRKIEDKKIEHVFALCGELLEQRDWALGVIAYDWAYRVRKQYTQETYEVFFQWLKQYVRGWGDCDDFCTHAFGALLMKYKTLFPKVADWTADYDFWVRRASAVVLIPAILHNDYEGIDPFVISDRLLADEHDLVQKGYGWMLKCLSQVDREAVEKYLTDRHGIMPRVAYWYALEKFDKETRLRMMAL